MPFIGQKSSAIKTRTVQDHLDKKGYRRKRQDILARRKAQDEALVSFAFQFTSFKGKLSFT